MSERRGCCECWTGRDTRGWFLKSYSLCRHPTGESTIARATLRFDRRIRLEVHGSTITQDAGLLACRELDDAMGLAEKASECFQGSRSGRDVQHQLAALLRYSVHSRLAGYENTDDAERLAEGSAMRVVRWMSRSLTDRRGARAPFAGSRSGYLHKTVT